ncbi:MAG: helix-turn-helix domain-containing protein [Acidimicrobiia bacterium]
MPAPRTRRQIQAEETRRVILATARKRFARDGYAATSLKAIAADAGVSVQTLYDSVGGKADLVRSLADLVDEEANIAEISGRLGTERDPVEVARIPAQVNRRLMERCGDIVRASIAGYYNDPGLIPVAEDGATRHRAGSAAVAAHLERLGALRSGLDVEAAKLTIAAIADHRLSIVLADDYGLSLDEIESWISDTIAQVVLEQPGSRS